MTLVPPNCEQQNVLNYLNRTREHVFITGRAGTGKTHALRWLQETTPKNSVVCAPTGIAAVNAMGSTIHNLLGLSASLPADDQPDWKKISRIRRLLDGVQVIVIDEVSMVSSAMMDAVDRNLRRIRQEPRTPFGGIQIVMFGDIYQLPPVVPKEDIKYYNDNDYRSEWFFDAHVWEETEFKTFGLEHIQRQSDSNFKELLNGVRDGSITWDQLRELNMLGLRTPAKTNKLLMLGSRRDMVAEYNTQNLKKLKGKTHFYQAKVMKGFGFQGPADRKLMLKPGAHVMMLNNDREQRWVNGTQGIVKACEADGVYVEIDGQTNIIGYNTWIKSGYAPEEFKLAPKFHQIPMRLAWAVTIHKSQGLSLPEIQIDLGTGAFSPGQTYVALSRVTDPSGLYLRTPLKMSDIKVDRHVRRFFDSI